MERTIDKLTPDWSIVQLKRGHRFSTDDIVLAFRASEAQPNATRLLDLGCGIGSVGLYTLWRLGNPDSKLTGVEAQEISAELACETIAMNGLQDEVSVINKDLRDVTESDLSAGGFELITGSPPYFAPGSCVHSPYSQRAHARVELRGTLHDYCKAARRFIAPDGRFCFVMPAADSRCESAPAEVGFTIVERFDYIFRRGREPQISTVICAPSESVENVQCAQKTVVIRENDGEWSEQYLEFREEMHTRLTLPV